MGIYADRVGNKQAMMLGAGLMVFASFWLLAARRYGCCFFRGCLCFGHGGIATMESPMVANIFGMRSHGVI